jgi:hypothetical protein
LQRLVSPLSVTSSLKRDGTSIVSYLFRSLGSVVGLSVGSSIIQDNLRKLLRMGLSGRDVDEVRLRYSPSSTIYDVYSLIGNQIVRRVRESLSYIDKLDPATAVFVRASYGQAIHTTLWFNVACAACAVLASVFIKEKTLSR